MQVAQATPADLAALAGKSLLRKGTSGRFETHELLRQYAAEKLAETALAEMVQERHSRYYADLLHAKEQDLKSLQQKETVAELGPDTENLRQGWMWALEHRNLEIIEQYVGILALLFEIRGWFKEGQQLFSTAIDRLKETGPGHNHGEIMDGLIVGKAIMYHGFFCYRLGNYDKARCLLLEAVELFQQSAVKLDLATAFMALGHIAFMVKDYAETKKQLQASHEILTEIHDEYLMVRTSCGLATLDAAKGHYAEAQQLFSESLAKSQKIGDIYGITRSLNGLALVAGTIGEYPRARSLYSESLSISAEVGNRLGTAVTLSYLGDIAYLLGDYAAARKLYQEALAMGRELGAPWSIAICLDRLGFAEYGLGRIEEARRLLEESMVIYQATQDRFGIARIQRGLGCVAFALGEYQEARRLHRDAIARFQEIGDKLAMVSAQNALGFDLWALHDYAAADQIFREALTQSLKMDTKPSVLESLAGLAATHYALAPAKGSPSQDRAIKCLEVLIYSQRHPACSQETRSRINLLMAQTFPTLSVAEASAIYSRVVHRKVEELATNL